MGQHSSASASRLLGLDGFQLVSAKLVYGEWQLVVQTRVTVVGCRSCGVRAELHGRRTVRVRDLPIGGRPVGKWPGASASGAVVSQPAGSRPGPNKRP